MKSLTEIIRKSHKQIYTGIIYSSLALMCATEIPKVKKEILRFKEETSVYKSKGYTIEREKISKFPALGTSFKVYDTEDQLVNEYNTNHLNGMMHWLTFQFTLFNLYAFSKLKKSPFSKLKTKDEKSKELIITGVTAGTTLCTLTYLTSGLPIKTQAEILYNGAGLITAYVNIRYNKSLIDEKIKRGSCQNNASQ